VTFDFLGKDSMRYFNTVELDERAYKNLESFTHKKKPKENIFDSLNTSLLNEHLKTLMPDLTAKVFRTYNASITLQKELTSGEKDIDADESIPNKVAFYNAANREVAILCNHQRSVPKGHESAVGKLREQIEALQDDKEEMEDWIEEMSSGKKGSKGDKKARDEREEARTERRQARFDKALAEAKAKSEQKKVEHAKLRAAGKEVDSEEEDENFGLKTKKQPKPSDLKKAEASLTKLTDRITNYEAKLSLREDNKEVALGTSKINYMDPRITVAWCKAKQVPLESVFNKSLVTKFPWCVQHTTHTVRFVLFLCLCLFSSSCCLFRFRAMEVPADWQF
jgi:DNA topoisomerase-1